MSQPDPSTRILITGLGLVSPLGFSAWQTFTALLAGRTLSARAAHLPAAIDQLNLVRAVGATAVGHHSCLDPAVELAERAAREALFEARLSAKDLPCYLGASKGAVATLDDTAAWFHTQRISRRGGPLPPPSPQVVALGPVGYVAHHVQRRLGLGRTRPFVAACASGLYALHQARQAMLTPGGPARVLVVSAEAALLPLFIHSYQRLGVLAPLNTKDYRAAPLDQSRHGFVLSELAAAVVLERCPAAPDLAGDNGVGSSRVVLELLDTAVANEPYDLIRPCLRMESLRYVAERLLAGRRLDVLHPHAPGTVEHDEAELAVYAKVLSSCANMQGRKRADHLTPSVSHHPFPSSPFLRLYACKGSLGHGLGAAGLVSLVVAGLCARSGRIPPMPWLTAPIASPLWSGPSSPLPERSGPETHAIFAAGFGGHVAGAVILSDRG